MALNWFKRKKEAQPETAPPEPAPLSLTVEDYYEQMHKAVEGYKAVWKEVKETGAAATKIQDRGLVHQFRLVNHVIRPNDGFETMDMTSNEFVDFCEKRKKGLSGMDRATMTERIDHLNSPQKMMSYKRAMERVDNYLRTGPRRRIG